MVPPQAIKVCPSVAQPSRWVATRNRVWRALRADCSGVTAIEYALMGSLVAIAIIGGVNGYSGSLGTLMNNAFTKIASAM